MFHNQNAEDPLTKQVLVGYCSSIAYVGPFAAEIDRSRNAILRTLVLERIRVDRGPYESVVACSQGTLSIGRLVLF